MHGLLFPPDIAGNWPDVSTGERARPSCVVNHQRNGIPQSHYFPCLHILLYIYTNEAVACFTFRQNSSLTAMTSSLFFSTKVVPNHIYRQHSVDRCILVFDGLVGHRVWKHVWYPAWGEFKLSVSLAIEKKTNKKTNSFHVAVCMKANTPILIK